MNKIRSTLFLFCFLSIFLIFNNCEVKEIPFDEGAWKEDPTSVSKIAFGSCADHEKAQPILSLVKDFNPDLFIYLGDNIYGDTEDMTLLNNKYAELSSKEEFKELARNVKILATWDDHDYGDNDAGKNYPKKAESKEVFLDFFREPENSMRRNRAGIYDAKIYDGGNDKKIQIILLDTRTFRDDLILNDGMSGCKNLYCPNENPDSTLLGTAQWQWLEEELMKEADIRIIASSIQFSHQYNGRESWTNLPREQEKLLDFIQQNEVNGVLFISGDLHIGEISKKEVPWQYPIYDITSSGITKTRTSYDEQNNNLIGSREFTNNFGWIEIDWSAPNPIISASIINELGTTSNSIEIDVSEISF